MHQSLPPRWIKPLLQWLLPDHLREELEGDLEEQFQAQVEESGEQKARWLYVLEVLRFCRPYFLKRRRKTSLQSHASPPITHTLPLDMLKNYFTVAFRQLLRRKGFASINILGLSLGMATCLVLLLYVAHELSYDRFHRQADHIYRITAEVSYGGKEMQMVQVPAPLAPVLRQDYPEVKSYVRLEGPSTWTVKKGQQQVQEKRVVRTDPTLFDVFTLPLLEGNPGTALREINSVVLTESMAKKYFGKTAVLGETLLFNNKQPFTVTGVMKDLPENSHFHFDFFIPFDWTSGWLKDSKELWPSYNFYAYLLLAEGSSPALMQQRANEALLRYGGKQMEQLLGKSLEAYSKTGGYFRFNLQPLTDIHLHSALLAEFEPNGNIEYVYLFIAVALFIVGIAAINFTNLSTAFAMRRAKEVGIRKALGSFRSGLIGQFLSEAILLSLLAYGVAFALVILLLPVFNQLTGKHLSLSGYQSLTLFLLGILPAVGVGLLAGSYPAFYLSNFRPVAVLKGKLTGGNRKTTLRQGLVVLQFALSILLVVGTLVVYRQVDYILSKQLGFTKEQVVVLDAYGSKTNLQTFKQEALRKSGIKGATVSSYLPVEGSDYAENIFFKQATAEQSETVVLQDWKVDGDFVKTLGMQIVQGRDFSGAFPSDSSGLLLNEAAVKVLGWQDPVGKTLYYLEDVQTKRLKAYRVVGVVKDFHFKSFRQTITPLALRLSQGWGRVSLRIEAGKTAEALTQLEQLWKQLNPSAPFSYSFLDESFAQMYASEQATRSMLTLFTLLALVIACLGLLGLVAYTTEQRRKEIGIRKVLGASVTGIMAMLSGEYVKLVLLAFVLSAPLAGYIVHRWLSTFAYRIEVPGWLFLLAGVVALALALLTVGVQAIKAAMANPVNSLRNE